MPSIRRGLGPATNPELLKRISKLEPGRRPNGFNVQRTAAFTYEETRRILEARREGVTWRAINEMLPYPYAADQVLGRAVRRSARRHGFNLTDYGEPE